MDNVIWSSMLATDSVAHLNEQELSLLINELDDAVARICEDYEIE
jgi:hypothetical protein